MSLSKSLNFGADTLILGQGDQDVNIVSQNGTNIKINGIVPSGGGGGGVPPVGDIDFIGNLNCNDVAGGGAKGIITAEKKVVSGIGGIETTGGVDIKANGNLTIEGNGNINQQGTGKITSGSGGIESKGDIKTIGSFDLEVGKDIYFDGQDIYHRTNNPVGQQSYKDFKQLAGKNDPNIFTGANQFNSNVNEFSEKVSVGTRDAGGLFTQNIALNKSGNIECQTLQNVTAITTGTITCDNGPLNECKARVFNTRTSGTNGWNIKQAKEEANPPGKLANNILQISATQVQAVGEPVEIYITSSEFNPSNGDNPNIKLIPDTVLNGGRVQASQYDLGTGGSRYYLKQDIGGVNDEVLQIKAPTAGASVNFKDNLNADVLVVKNTAVQLSPSIPINFGAYSWKPTQFYKDLNAFSFNHNAIGPTNQIFTTSDTDWINKNTGATGQSLNLGNLANRGSYKLTFAQISAGILGEINDFRLMSDIVLTLANDGSPEIILPSPIAYSFEAYDGQGQPPIITMTPGFLVYNVYATFPQVSGNEISNVRITLTKMDFFA